MNRKGKNKGKKNKKEAHYQKPYIRLIDHLCKINLKSRNENMKLASKIVSEALFLGCIYFVFMYFLFNALWYLKLLCFVSTAIFITLYIQIRIEFIYFGIMKDIPRAFRKFTHYMMHYNGNVIQALEETEIIVKTSMKPFFAKMIEIIRSSDVEQQFEIAKNKMNIRWITMLYELIKYAHIHGDKNSIDDNLVSNNIGKLIQLISKINLNQGNDNVSIIGIEIFIFFAPLICVPFTQYSYSSIWSEIDGRMLYGTIDAQIITAQILLFANMATLFVNWVRKND